MARRIAYLTDYSNGFTPNGSFLGYEAGAGGGTIILPLFCWTGREYLPRRTEIGRRALLEGGFMVRNLGILLTDTLRYYVTLRLNPLLV